MYLVFTCMPCESCRGWLVSLLSCFCNVLRLLITSLVRWFCTGALSLVLFQATKQLPSRKKHFVVMFAWCNAGLFLLLLFFLLSVCVCACVWVCVCRQHCHFPRKAYAVCFMGTEKSGSHQMAITGTAGLVSWIQYAKGDDEEGRFLHISRHTKMALVSISMLNYLIGDVSTRFYCFFKTIPLQSPCETISFTEPHPPVTFSLSLSLSLSLFCDGELISRKRQAAVFESLHNLGDFD